VDSDKSAVAIGTGNVAAQTLAFSNPNLSISNGNTVDLSSLSTSPDSAVWATLYALQDTASTLRAELAGGGTDSTVFATVYLTDTLSAAIRSEKADASHTHVEADITDLAHYTDADIDGNETAFSGWDKNAADDFDGAFSSLTGIPSGLSDGDDVGLTSIDSSIFASVYRVDTASAAIRSELHDAVTLTGAGTYISLSSQQITVDAITESDISDLDHFTGADITGAETAFSGWDKNASDDVGQLSDLSDVNTSTATNRNVLVADGVDWESRALVEADISDLGSYLTAESNDLTAAVTWANVPDVNITQSSVTQHEAALTITESQISDLSHTTDTKLSQEEVEDFTGAMFSGNTETLITATYQDIDGTIDLVVDNDLSQYDNTTSGFLTEISQDATPKAGGELDMQGNNIIDLGDVTFQTGVSGGTLRTGTSAADKFRLQAYDVDGGSYTTLMEAYAGNDPQMQIFVDYFHFEDAADPTKIVDLDVSGVSTGTTRTFSFPDASGTFELEGHTHTEGEISDLSHYTDSDIDGNEAAFTGWDKNASDDVGQLSDLSDVNTSTPTNRNVLVADGVDWESRALVEADISDLGSYLTTESNDLTAAVTWANVPDANITQTSVTQHQAALTITESQISDLQSYLTAEVDGSTTNELQTIDVITLDSFLLQLSLASDGEATKELNLSRFGTTGPETDAVFTATFTAKKGIKNLVDCTSSAITVTPPSTPATGDTFAVVDARGNSGTNNITIDFSTATQNLYGSAQDYILNADGGAVEFYYIGATTGWVSNK